jgi:hypothetical protein
MAGNKSVVAKDAQDASNAFDFPIFVSRNTMTENKNPAARHREAGLVQVFLVT